MNNTQRFKVNRLYVGSYPRKLLIANFNIPMSVLNITNIETIYRRILLDFDLPEDYIYFNISATYVLKHRDTQEEKLFLGSFHSRGMSMSTLSRFRSLDSVNFVPFVSGKVIDEDFTHKLKLAGQSTVWELDRILSIIISVQGVIKTNHHALSPESNLG